MRKYVADLHIHTCLSPCAELEMTPSAIMKRAAELGIDMVAIADHNSAGNVAAAVRAGREAGVHVIAAMELTSKEEAHVLAFFGSIEEAIRMQGEVFKYLPKMQVPKDDHRHWQVLVDEHDEVHGFEQRMLLGTTGMLLAELVRKIHEMGGVAVASHVDREAFSVMSQMGFVPQEIDFDGFEVIRPERAKAVLPFHQGASLIMSSDSHRLADIGRRTTEILLSEPSFEELAMAIRQQEGRCVTGHKAG